ncbi:MAG: hypothetical protein Tsb0021_17030 [Chlamydiales bacterium]
MKKETNFLRNWETLKPLLLAKWKKLNERELDNISPTEKELIKVVHKHYQNLPEQTILEEIKNLDDQILKNY